MNNLMNLHSVVLETQYVTLKQETKDYIQVYLKGCTPFMCMKENPCVIVQQVSLPITDVMQVKYIHIDHASIYIILYLFIYLPCAHVVE